jgi:hypothetical protein
MHRLNEADMENNRYQYDLGELLVQYEDPFKTRYPLSPGQGKVFADLTRCRTSALGGHQDECDQCGHRQHSYNSCRNRHCPKCQYVKQVEWIDRLKHNLPPTRYFHLVFTIPQELHRIFYINQKVCYDLLFRSATASIQHAAKGRSGLGATVGGVSVLHTWGQALTYHPHIHLIIPAGGLSEDRMEWVASPKKFFLPVKVLSRIFRGILCKNLAEVINKGYAFLPGDFSWKELKDKLYQKNWNVCAKSLLTGPDRVIEYLGRYTHRVAISNSRILGVEKDQITFKIKDYRTDNYTSTLTLPVVEFIRRFFQHVLPTGFYKIRYFGFLSLSQAKELVGLVFELLEKSQFLPRLEGLNGLEIYQAISGKRQWLCPVCKSGFMHPYYQNFSSD